MNSFIKKEPYDGKNYWINDLKAGLVVFLIALPLSLGISLASGAPSSAGLISAILGGLLGAYLGGSYVTINGPAAGLIVVVLSAIQTLGAGDPVLGFRRMLACVFIVGIIQIISGILKAGRLAALFPLSVVHGMLTAIGLIIIIKQSYVFLGHKSHGSILASLIHVPQSLLAPVPESALIGLVSIATLLVYPHLKTSFAKVVPAPLIVAIIGIIMSKFLAPAAMVSIPTDPSKLIIFPLFDSITSYQSIVATITIFFVASLESILSTSAVDKLDPLGRESDFNRELWSKGLVNVACGLFGGLPIIAEIVRSSANIAQGAKTPLSNFMHSVFILFFVILFPTILNSIPLSALAAILIIVGYRLAHPKQLKEMWKLGAPSFIAFITTIVVTLAEDLLIGVFAGIAVKALLCILKGAKLKSILTPDFKLEARGEEAILRFEGSLTFFSILRQKDILNQVSQFRTLYIDLSRLTFVDATTLSFLFRETMKMERNGLVVNVLVPQTYESTYKSIQEH